MRLPGRTTQAAVTLACCLAAGPAYLAGVPKTRPLDRTPALIPAFTNEQAGRAATADWIEPAFPFFSSVVDVRQAGGDLPADNLTPRGLVLNLGRDCWAAFDTDLLRVAVVWRGEGLTPVALAPGSYEDGGRKTPTGQSPAPEPIGRVWIANGIYPGWQRGERPSLDDPREPAPSPEEVGRGPLPDGMGRFHSIRLVPDGVVLEYTSGGAGVREWITASDHSGVPIVERHFRIAAPESMWLMLGAKAEDVSISIGSRNGAAPALETIDGVWAVRVPGGPAPVTFTVGMADQVSVLAAPRELPATAPEPRWPQEIATRVTRSTAGDAFVVDDVELPVANPWDRAVRISDIQFFADGTGAGVTLDGDVWLVRGLHEDEGIARWRRFASGLHEPLTLAIRDGEIYVFDRNGIWRLRDTNGDGEADLYELFSNAFAQTADMREFPNTIRLAPGGEFVIAKGNQQATTLGKHNGHVLRISADGRKATVLGYGFRQPNIGVNPWTGLVTASDQQGNYVPATPLHIVRDAQFYGFLSALQPREQYPAPIARPLTWIPHPVNASGVSQVWLIDARMGPLNGALVHIGFNRPELFRVLMHDRGATPQAAVVSITRAFDFPPLNGSVNPADGQLYVAGFQILGWGTTATRVAGLGRVRYTGQVSTLPREVVAMDTGVLLRFDAPLDATAAADPDNYSLGRWKYRRTYKYGSPQLKADGTPGVDALVASRAYLSADGQGVFVAVPDMKPAMQMRVGWSLATADGVQFRENAYFTPYDLPAFDPGAEGFGELTIDLSPRRAIAASATPVTPEEGRRLFDLYGCAACHAIDTTAGDRLGPPLKGLYGRERLFEKAGRVTADETYLREALRDPAAKIVPGFERGDAGMPSYAGVLTPAQIDALIALIRSLE